METLTACTWLAVAHMHCDPFVTRNGTLGTSYYSIVASIHINWQEEGRWRQRLWPVPDSQPSHRTCTGRGETLYLSHILLHPFSNSLTSLPERAVQFLFSGECGFMHRAIVVAYSCCNYSTGEQAVFVVQLCERLGCVCELS